MPAAHLLIVLKVPGATMIASGRRQRVGFVGLFVVVADLVAGQLGKARQVRELQR